MGGEKIRLRKGIYSIEQCKDDDELIAFVNDRYRESRQVCEDTVHKEIAYCRSIVNTQSGKDYYGDGEDDETYDEVGLRDTRRFRSAACNQKNK